MGQNILWMTVGLPRSGKSTRTQGMGRPVVSGDAIRQALGCYPFIPDMEPTVWRTARVMVEALFNAGHRQVVLDSCNQTVSRRDEWKSERWRREYIVVSTPKEVCIERANATGQGYLAPIIEKMAAEYEEPSDCERS